MSNAQTLQELLMAHPEITRSERRPGVFKITTDGQDLYYDYRRHNDTDNDLAARLKTAMAIIKALRPEIKEFTIGKYFDTGDYKVLITIHDDARVSVYIRYVTHPSVIIRYTHKDITIGHIARSGGDVESIYTVDKTFDTVDNFKADFFDLLRQLKDALDHFGKETTTHKVVIKTTFQDVLNTVFNYAIEQNIMNRAFADVLKTKDVNEHTLADENKQLTPFGQELFDHIGVTYQRETSYSTDDDSYYDVYMLTFKN